jgi:hypothetical protein
MYTICTNLESHSSIVLSWTVNLPASFRHIPIAGFSAKDFTAVFMYAQRTVMLGGCGDAPA